MQKVLKYPLPFLEEFILELPQGTHPLSVQMQGAIPCLWALGDDACPMTERQFRMVGAGQEIDRWALDNPDSRIMFYYPYIGTFQFEELVFHLFEMVRRSAKQ